MKKVLKITKDFFTRFELFTPSIIIYLYSINIIPVCNRNNEGVWTN